MHFKVCLTKQADFDLRVLCENPNMEKRLKAVKKAIGYLGVNTRHPSLRTHKYTAIKGINGEDVFEAYAENNTSGAYRIFWQYGLDKQALTILGIVAHP